MNFPSPCRRTCLRRPLPLFLCLVVAAAVEECSNAGPALTDALVDDDDRPLSLVQVKAIATRNNKTQNSNQTSDLGNATTALSMLPGTGFVGMTAYAVSSETMHAFYLAFTILVLVLVVNLSMLYAQLKKQDKKKMQSVPVFQLPVDHLVASSKLNLKPAAGKNQLRFYSRVNRSSSFNGVVSEAPKSEQPADEKPHWSGEALDSKLVLPLRETWYAVAIEQVLKADGSFEILRITGCPSLRASVSHNKNGRDGTLELFCCSGGATKHVLATASTLTSQTSKISMDVVGAVELADCQGRCLGQLRPVTNKSFEFVRNSKPLVTLAVDDAGQLELSSVGGSRLACVSCLAGHLGICVNAGEDTALVICLVLSSVLLGGAHAHVLPKAGTVEAASDAPTLQDIDLDDAS